jgi:hypothetical protein
MNKYIYIFTTVTVRIYICIIYMDLVHQYHLRHTHTHTCWPLAMSFHIPRHTIFDLFLIFIFLQYLGDTSPTPTFYFCTIANHHLSIGSASLSVAVYYFYASSPIMRSAVRQLPLTTFLYGRASECATTSWQPTRC